MPHTLTILTLLTLSIYLELRREVDAVEHITH